MFNMPIIFVHSRYNGSICYYLQTLLQQVSVESCVPDKSLKTGHRLQPMEVRHYPGNDVALSSLQRHFLSG